MIDEVKKIIEELGGTLIKGTLAVEKFSYKLRDDVVKAIGDFDPETGWLCFTDKVVLLDELDAGSLKNGILLSAELVNGKQSLHIRQQGDSWGGWIYTSDKNGDELILEQSFLGTSRTKGRRLCYQTLWKEVDGSLQPTLSRFTGFVKGDN